MAIVGLGVVALLAAIGLPPISGHGPRHFIVVMHPLCGVTRGSVATLGGDVARAAWFNPASPFVPIKGALLLAR